MRKIAFMNQKGGVGKTTCAVNVGAGLAQLGKRVLLIDMDPQANLSLHLNLDAHRLVHSSYSLLTRRSSASEAVIAEVREGLSVVPANIDLSGAEVELVNEVGREIVLKDRMRAFLESESFDYVLVDCPPSLGLLSLNALTFVDEVIVPLQTEFFALQGMTRLLDVVELIRERLNSSLKVASIVATLFDPRTNLSGEVLDEIRRYFGDKVCDSVIHVNVRLAEAPSHGQTIFEYAPSSRGARDFRSLAQEIRAQERELVTG